MVLVMLYHYKNSKELFPHHNTIRFFHKGYPYKELNDTLSYQKARPYLKIYNCRITHLVIFSSLIALIKEWKASNISFVIVEVAQCFLLEQ